MSDLCLQGKVELGGFHHGPYLLSLHPDLVKQTMSPRSKSVPSESSQHRSSVLISARQEARPNPRILLGSGHSGCLVQTHSPRTSGSRIKQRVFRELPAAQKALGQSQAPRCMPENTLLLTLTDGRCSVWEEKGAQAPGGRTKLQPVGTSRVG